MYFSEFSNFYFFFHFLLLYKDNNISKKKISPRIKLFALQLIDFKIFNNCKFAYLYAHVQNA